MEKLSWPRVLSVLALYTLLLHSVLAFVLVNVSVQQADSDFLDIAVSLGAGAADGLQWGIGVVSAVLFGIYGVVAVAEAADRATTVERRTLAHAAMLVVAGFSPALVASIVYYLCNTSGPQFGQLMWLVPTTVLFFVTAAYVGRFHIFSPREELANVREAIVRRRIRSARQTVPGIGSRLRWSIPLHFGVACAVGVGPSAAAINDQEASGTGVVMAVYAVLLMVLVTGVRSETVGQGWGCCSGQPVTLRSRRRKRPPIAVVGSSALIVALLTLVVLVVIAVFAVSGTVAGIFLLVVVGWLFVSSMRVISVKGISMTLLGDFLASEVRRERSEIDRLTIREIELQRSAKPNW